MKVKRWSRPASIIFSVLFIAILCFTLLPSLIPFGGAGVASAASPETFYPNAHAESTSVDGRTAYSNWVNGAWATVHDSTGTNCVADDTSASLGRIAGWFTGAQSYYWELYRSVYIFDTSGLPDDATIISAVFSIYGTAKVSTASVHETYNVYASSPASNTGLVANDYDNFAATAYSTAKAQADWSTTGYNDFTLNATGIGNISLGNVTKLAIRGATYDAPNSSPGSAGAYAEESIGGYYADQAGTDKDPKLVVTYTVPTPLTIATLAATSVTATSATLNGNVTSLGSYGNVTSIGFGWSLTSQATPGNVTPANSGYKTYENLLLGTFDHSVTNQYPNLRGLDKWTATGNGTVSLIRIYGGAGGGHAKVALYSDDVGAPDALLSGQGTSTTLTAAVWNDCALGNSVAITKDTVYWIASNMDTAYGTTSTSHGITGGDTHFWIAASYANAFPDTAGSGYTENDTPASCYAAVVQDGNYQLDSLNYGAGQTFSYIIPTGSLLDGTTYYFRAGAYNSYGWSWSTAQLTFTTLRLISLDYNHTEGITKDPCIVKKGAEDYRAFITSAISGQGIGEYTSSDKVNWTLTQYLPLGGNYSQWGPKTYYNEGGGNYTWILTCDTSPDNNWDDNLVIVWFSSPDLDTWTSRGLLFTGTTGLHKGVNSMKIYKFGSTYYGYYEGFHYDAGHAHYIGYATTTDDPEDWGNTSWTDQGLIFYTDSAYWEGTYCGSPTVNYVDGLYYMHYGASNTQDTHVGYCTDDNPEFSSPSAHIQITTINLPDFIKVQQCNPDVQYMDGEWEMAFHGSSVYEAGDHTIYNIGIMVASSFPGTWVVDQIPNVEFPDISNTPSLWSVGVVQPSQTYWAKTGLTPPSFPLAAGNCTGNVTSNSSFTLDYLTVVITDFSGGTAINIVSTAPGTNEVRVMIFESGAGNDTDGIYLTNAAQNWVADVAASEEVYWELKLETGNRNTFGYGVYTATLTFTTDPAGDTADVIITFTWGDRRRGIGIAPAFFY